MGTVRPSPGGASPAVLKPGAAGIAGRGLFASWLSLLVALPLAVLAWHGLEGGPSGVLAALELPYAWEALQLTLWTSAVTAILNAVMGTATAWVLVRYRFWGRSLLSMLVDLPLAIPTLVAGLMIVNLFGPQTPLGAWCKGLGFPVAFAVPGIVLALLFINLPFVVRSVEPVLMDLDPAEEEAAVILGARTWTTLRRVLLPPLAPAIAGGTLQGFARALAEFGSIVVVSGNIPGRTLTSPVFIFGEVEAGRTEAAAAVSVVLLAIAIGLQPAVRWLNRLAGARHV
ncbi:MAG: sulfate ABC transporter permease subunit [Deltaproteobacteria bacterium]|nr:sulfate ABC transporter permease subunit [Deltaproteobacteria bacterium]